MTKMSRNNEFFLKCWKCKTEFPTHNKLTEHKRVNHAY